MRVQLTREVLHYLKESLNEQDCSRELLRLVAEYRGFGISLADEIVQLLLEWPDELRNEWLGRLKQMPGPLVAYLLSALELNQGNHQHAFDKLGECIRSTPAPDPMLYGQRARLAVKLGLESVAISELQRAISLNPPHRFFMRIESLLNKVLKGKSWGPRRKTRIALIGEASLDLLAPVIKAKCFAEGIEADIYVGTFGNMRQEIIDQNSGLYEFKPDVVVMLPVTETLGSAPLIENTSAAGVAAELRELWQVLRHRHPCHVIQTSYGLPFKTAWGSLEDTLPTGRRRFVAELNLELSKEMPSGVSYIDINYVAAESGYPLIVLEDWYRMRQYPNVHLLPRLADYILSQVRAVLGLAYKVLILDLDNTLWGGVIGEDHLDGILLGAPSPEGEAHVDLQRLAK